MELLTLPTLVAHILHVGSKFDSDVDLFRFLRSISDKQIEDLNREFNHKWTGAEPNTAGERAAFGRFLETYGRDLANFALNKLKVDKDSLNGKNFINLMRGWEVDDINPEFVEIARDFYRSNLKP